MRAWCQRQRAYHVSLHQVARATNGALEYRQTLEEIQQRMTRYEREIETLAQTSPHAPTIGALQAMRGVKLITAATIVSELGDIGRGRVRRGSITKTGNAHLRRVIIESAWHYRHAPGVSGDLRKRQRDVPAPACAIAWNAQQRLNKRYRHLLARGKTSHQTVVAVGREKPHQPIPAAA
jgi:transposase